MAVFAGGRDMDTFVFNSTVAKDANYLSSQAPNTSGDLIPIFLSDAVFSIKAGKESVEHAGTVRKIPHQQIFSHGYASDEEAASPVEDNDYSFQSTTDTESTPSIRETPSLESLSDYSNTVQLCARAQVVKFLSVGKARLISVPRLVDVSSARSSPGSVGNAAVVRVSKLNRATAVYVKPQYRSPRSSSDTSESSNSIEEHQVQPRTIRRKPNLPPLRPVQNSTAPHTTKIRTPLTEQRAEFIKQAPYVKRDLVPELFKQAPHVKPDPVPSTPPLRSSLSPVIRSPSMRKLPKLSPTFGLKAFGRSRRSNSTASSSGDEFEGRIDWWNLTPSPALSNLPSAPRPDRLPRPKMIARGANEVAPTLVLPPCPEDYRHDYDVGPISQWPLRNDSVPRETDDTLSALKQIRKRSRLAAFATAQA